MNRGTIKKLEPKLRFPEFKKTEAWSAQTIGEALASQSSIIAQNKLSFVHEGYAVYGADGFLGNIESYEQSEDYIAIIKDGSGVGRLSFYKGKSSVLGTLTYLKSKDRDKYNLIWLFYLLQTVDFTTYIKGAGIPHIYYSDYSKHPVTIPAPKEQQKIADCLSSLDELITTENKKLEALQLHKKGLMQQLFPAEGEKVPKLRFKEFRDSGEWAEKSIQELINEKSIVDHLDGNHGSLYPKAEEFSSQGIPYITANDFVDGFVNFTDCKFLPYERAKQFKKGIAIDGDILFAHNATVGPVAKLNTKFEFVILSTTATYFRCDNESLLNDFLKFGLCSPKFIYQYSRVMAQSTRNQVPITAQRKFYLQVPSENEQRAVAKCLYSLDSLIIEQSQKIESLKSHKKGLIQQLFPNVNEIE